jgi:hypothetical protein
MYVARIKSEGVKGKLKAYGSYIDNLKAVAKLLKSVAKPIDQKVTGTEHRYKTEATIPKSTQRIEIKRQKGNLNGRQQEQPKA